MRRSRSGIRRLLAAALLVVAVGVLLVALAVLALRVPRIQQSVLARVSRWTEAAAGFSTEADGFRLRPLAGVLEVDRPRLRVPGERPFAGAERLQARWRPTSILQARVDLELLSLERPRVDLAAPLPPPRATDDDEPPREELPLEIERLAIRDGEMVGLGRLPGSENLGVGAESSVTELGIDAAFDGRRLDVRELAAAVVLASTDREPVPLEVELRAGMDLGGAVDVESLRLTGDDLAAELSGHFDPGLEESRAVFEVRLDPGSWLLGRQTGSLVARGDVDLGSWRGSATLAGARQPAALLAGLLPAEERLELDRTAFELTADLRLEAERAVAGIVRLVGFVDEQPILEVEARPRLELAGELPAAIVGHASILPGEPGTRRLEARLSTPASRTLEAWTIDDGRASVEAPELEALLSEIARLYPRLLAPGSISELPPLGRLSAGGWFRGGPTDPEIDLQAELRPPGGGQLRLTATGRPLSLPLVVETSGADVELGSFTPAATGRLDWSGRVRDPLGTITGELTVTARDLSTADGTVFNSLSAEISGSRRLVAWRLDGRAEPGRRLAGTGTIEPILPLRRASGELTLGTGDDRLPGVEASFGLAGGALTARLTAALSGREPVTLEAKAPLAALEKLPQLAGLARLPLARSAGPVTVEWTASAGDWSALVPAALIERIGRLEAGTAGQLTLDTVCPSCSGGKAVVSRLDFELDGRRAQATTDLELVFEGGRLRIAPWSLAGDGFELEAAAEVELSAAWRPADRLAALATGTSAVVDARVDSAWLQSLPLEIVAPGVVSVHAEIQGPLENLAGSAEISAPGLSVASTEFPAITMAEPALRLSLAEGLLTWEEARLQVGSATVSSRGESRVEAPLVSTAGIVEVVSGLPVLERATLPFALRDGLLEIEGGAFETPSGRGSIRLAAPIDARPGGLAHFEWDLPVNDWAPLLARLGAEDPEILELATRGAVALSPERPALADATVSVDSARVVMRGRETRFEPSLEITVGDGEARLAPFVLRSGEETFDIEARALLERAWAPGDPPGELITELDVSGRGEIDAGLLNPFLAGGRAEGPLGLDFEAAGSPASLGGHLRIEGPEASLLFRRPYLARLERPSLRFSLVDGRFDLEEGSLILNEGPLELSGIVWDAGESDLRIRFSEALFRLDYGLLATLGGDLQFRLAADGSSTLGGRLDVDRGSLTRSLQLDVDLVSQLLAPIDLTTTEEDVGDRIALDVEVRAREGVRIKNNLADLLVRWEPLAVTGTLARPVIEGRLEADPGGLLHLYGQTVRLDKAAIEYPGEEGADPRLELEATTSLEDPTIGRLAGDDPFRASSRGDPTQTPEAADVTADLARYLGEQFAGRIGESVGFTLSLRPLLIFGETDPGARLTVSRDLSPNLAIAASIDLQEAEGQTYLLEMHELRRLPRLVAQAFTDDESAYGGALLLRQEFGGTKKGEEGSLPRISKLAVETLPAGVSKRGIKRALGLDKGDPFDSADRFLAEVELADYLLGKGYPDARVSVRPTSAGRLGQKVRLEIAIEPGPRTEFAFAGEKIPKPLRPLITSLYRPDFFEAESIEEMKAEAVRALRSQGFLEPTVGVAVEPLDPDSPGGDRRVVVEIDGGVRSSAGPPVFTGIPAAEAEALRAYFFNTVQRVELAVGMPSADRRLLAALSDLGYPQARIASRSQSLGERVLTVEIEPGPRQEIAAVAIESTGEPPVATEELESLLTVAPGDPLRRRELSRSAVAIERELGARGHLQARVQTILEPAGGDRPDARAVRFVVDPGTVSQLAEIEFTGLRSTRPKWARGVADLEPGRVLARDDLAAARTRLWRTGLFSGVTTGRLALEPGLERVVFDLAERDRFRLTYGVRWDSEAGSGAVFDATDNHFLGRGWTLGLRALYSNDERSLRWLTRIPRAFGGPGTLEFFAAAREVTETAFDFFSGTIEIDTEILEGTLQYSHPLGARRTLRVYWRHTDTKRPLPFITVRVKNPQLGVQYVFDSRPAVPLPESGWFASVDLSGSESFLGGDLRYARLFSQLNLSLPLAELGGRRLSWAQSYRLGLAEAFGQELIREVRFFAGGEYSVRGYETESLGEQSTFGSIAEPTGGASLLVVNQELRWRLFEDYVLVLFADAGNVWPEIGELGFDLSTSAGIGLRALTPIGLLRADFAHALDRRPEIDPEFKFYFGLGMTF